MAEKELFKSVNPKKEAEIILSHVIKKDRSFIISSKEKKLTPKKIEKLHNLLFRRKLGEPIAYLIGECEFWSLPIYVSQSIFIPRPDTECLVEKALTKLQNVENYKILELGTGTGAISLAISKERPDCKITAIDISPNAIKLAKRNIRRLNIKNINIKESCWFNSLKNKYFDLIISNPPYLDEKDPYLKKGDLRFESCISLISRNSGFADLEHIIINSKKHLYRNGWLLIEHGWKQGKIVRSFFIREKYQLVNTFRDYNGNERITVGQVL